MPGPSINATLVDPGALGAPTSTEQEPLYVGVASQGDLLLAQSFTRLDRVVAEYGHGHLVDVAAAAFAGGARQVKLCRVAAADAGDIIGEDDTDASLLLTSVEGDALHFLAVRIEVVAGGAGAISTGTWSVKYSLDNWEIPFVNPTFSAPVLVPADGSLSLAGVGLDVTIEITQTPTAGDFVEFEVVAGHYGATEIAACADVARSPQADQFTYFCFTGSAADAAAGNTNATAIATLLATLFSEGRIVGALADSGTLESDTATISAFAAAVSDPPFLSVGFGAVYTSSGQPLVARGRFALREHEVASIRIAKSLVSTDPGRTASGALENAVGTDYDAALEGDALHDARISTVRTWMPHARGLYIQRQRLLSPTVSDFITWPHAAVMIVALRAAHRVGFQLVLETVRKAAGGTLDPRDAADIQEAMLAEIGRLLLTPLNVRGTPGHISAARCEVDLTAVLPVMRVDIKIRPVGYPSDLSFTLSYNDA